MDSTPEYNAEISAPFAQLQPAHRGALTPEAPLEFFDYASIKNPLSAALCTNCAHLYYPAQSRCARCRGARVEALTLCGRAKLYAAKLAAVPGELSVGRVLLDEGFWVRALLVGSAAQFKGLCARLGRAPIDVEPTILRTQGIAIAAFKLLEERPR